jgi:hypothetical protein
MADWHDLKAEQAKNKETQVFHEQRAAIWRTK